MDATYDDSILNSLRRITRAIAVYSRKLAATYKITAPQLVCLRYPDQNGPHTPSELAREVSLSQATVTGILDRLEIRGLLERRRDHKDRRRVSVHLTPEGMESSQTAPKPSQELFAGRLAELH
jgi:DNA-binding MarR family transcriptional regulator